MTRIAEAIAAVALIVAAVVAWNLGVTTATYGAVPGGPPEFVSTHYSGSWIAGATVCVLIAGLLAVDGIRRTIALRSPTP